MPPSCRPPDDESRYLVADAKRSPLNNESYSDELFLILGRLNSFGTDMDRVEFIMEDKGLGPLPAVVKSVGSLLLFNSDINPYKDYQTLDNLLSSGKSKEQIDDSNKFNLASAPTTLISGDALPEIGNLDLTFKPEMGDMAALALPSNLPLDFLAGSNDIQLLLLLLLLLMMLLMMLLLLIAQIFNTLE